MKKKTLLNTKERAILKYIDAQGGAVTPNEIAQDTGISYITVRKYLKRMVNEGILKVQDD